MVVPWRIGRQLGSAYIPTRYLVCRLERGSGRANATAGEREQQSVRERRCREPAPSRSVSSFPPPSLLLSSLCLSPPARSSLQSLDYVVVWLALGAARRLSSIRRLFAHLSPIVPLNFSAIGRATIKKPARIPLSHSHRVYSIFSWLRSCDRRIACLRLTDE